MATVTMPLSTSSAAGSSVVPSRNPLPLTANQESQVRELYHKRVRTKCADQVRGTPNTLLFQNLSLCPSELHINLFPIT